jgi:hypothetical protein
MSHQKALDIRCSSAATNFSKRGNFLLLHFYSRESAQQISIKVFPKRPEFRIALKTSTLFANEILITLKIRKKTGVLLF